VFCKKKAEPSTSQPSLWAVHSHSSGEERPCFRRNKSSQIWALVPHPQKVSIFTNTNKYLSTSSGACGCNSVRNIGGRKAEHVACALEISHVYNTIAGNLSVDADDIIIHRSCGDMTRIKLALNSEKPGWFNRYINGLLPNRPGFDSWQGQIVLSILHSVQTSSWSHRAPGESFHGVKRPGCASDQSLPSSSKVKNGGYIPPLPHIFSWCGT
jgi:hypothetical protein